MKHSTILASLVICAGLRAGAAQDFDAIKPDIRHMTETLQAAFTAEPACDYCRSSIKAIYLAGQGALFELSAPHTPAFASNGADFPPASPDTIRIVRNMDHTQGSADHHQPGANNILAGPHQVSIELERGGQPLPADADKAHTERLVQLQQLTLKVFCHHGAILRRLPAGEHVTLVFSLSNSARQSQVYVFDKSRIENCNSTAELRQSAMAYLY